MTVRFLGVILVRLRLLYINICIKIKLLHENLINPSEGTTMEAIETRKGSRPIRLKIPLGIIRRLFIVLARKPETWKKNTDMQFVLHRGINIELVLCIEFVLLYMYCVLMPLCRVLCSLSYYRCIVY